MKPKLAIIGAGELGKQILFQAENDCGYYVVGFFDDFCKMDSYLNKPLLGKTNSVQKLFDSSVFDYLMIGVGYARMNYRADIFRKFEHLPFATLIHPDAKVEITSNIGKGTIIYPNVYIGADTEIKQNVLINIGVTISHNNFVGNHTYISPSVSVGGYTNIGEKAFVGINSTLINHIKVCESSIIGAGSVVVKNIDTEGTYAGVPAKKIK